MGLLGSIGKAFGGVAKVAGGLLGGGGAAPAESSGAIQAVQQPQGNPLLDYMAKQQELNQQAQQASQAQNARLMQSPGMIGGGAGPPGVDSAQGMPPTGDEYDANTALNATLDALRNRGGYSS